jgi:hypothetical protein
MSKLQADYILDMKRVKQLEAENKAHLAQLMPILEKKKADEMVTRNTINFNLAMNKLNVSYRNICSGYINKIKDINGKLGEKGLSAPEKSFWEWRRKQMVTYLTDVVERTKLFNEDLNRVEEEHETLFEESERKLKEGDK